MSRKNEFFKGSYNALAYVLALVIIASFLLFRYAPDCGMKYDAGMYAGIAYSLHSKGEYSYNGVKGDLPPAFPLMLTLALSFGEDTIDYVVPISAVLLAISAFLFFSLHGRARYAFLIALLVFTNPAVFEYSLGHFRDVPVLFFTFMFYFLYEKSIRNKQVEMLKDERKLAIATGIFFALAFLSTYSAFIYFLPILLHAALNRNRSMLISLGVAILIIFPWAAWSMKNFNTPFVEHSSYLIKNLKIEKGLNYFFGFLFPRFITFSWVLFILGTLGFLKEIKDKKTDIAKDIYFQLAIFTIAPNSIWPEQEIRYLFPALISLGYFAVRFLSSMKREHALTLLLFAGIAFQGSMATEIADYNCPRFSLIKDAGLWLRENTHEGDKLMAGSFYQISYYARRLTYQIPPNDLKKAEELIKKNSIKYVIVDTYEKTTPVYARTYFEKYELTERFSQGQEEVRIYRLS